MTDTRTATDAATQAVLEDLQTLVSRARRCIKALAFSVQEDGPIKAINWHGHHAIWGETVCSLVQRYEDDWQSLDGWSERAALRGWRDTIQLTMNDTISTALTPLEVMTWGARHKAKVDLLRLTQPLEGRA
jgi:ligand-binding SRPBCC domain-containing protein